LLFAIDRLIDLIEALPIDKPRRVVIISESLSPMRFVLKNTPVQIVSHPNIEGPPGAALQDVNEKVILARHASTICA
jgi:hypothetical protein